MIELIMAIGCEPLLRREIVMERKHRCRLANGEIEAEISDGHHCYSGTIANLSCCGLAVENLPADINYDVGTLYLNVRAAGDVYQLRAIPRWVDSSSVNKKIGMHIFYMPRTWIKFVRSLG